MSVSNVCMRLRFIGGHLSSTETITFGKKCYVGISLDFTPDFVMKGIFLPNYDNHLKSCKIRSHCIRGPPAIVSMKRRKKGFP